MFSIYKITNRLNSKVYIGQTSKTLQERFAAHLKCAKKHINRCLYDAMNKYGYQNFSIELLEHCTKEEADTKEQEWIARYQATNRAFGYNMTAGGGGGNTWSANLHKAETSAKSKATKIKNGTYGKFYGPHTNSMKGKHFKHIPKQELLECILAPMTANQIAELYKCSYRLVLSLAREYFGTTINKVRAQYGVSFARTKLQLESLQRNRAPAKTGQQNHMYKDISKETIISAIQNSNDDLELLQQLNISRPTYITKCKNLFGLLPRQVRKKYSVSIIIDP